MHLDTTIHKFYTSILNYAGIEEKDTILVNKNQKLGDISINDKPLSLPYFEILKNPDRVRVFHPLNENYTNPETDIFDIYKRRLTLELNLKFSHVFINCIRLASDIQLQQRIKSSKLIKLVSSIGDTDPSFVDSYLSLVKASQKVNNESFIFDIYLKKNGEINGTPYAAIGKVNFLLYTEINKALDDPNKDYKVFGYKLRKKDLLIFKNIFNVIFPNIDDSDKFLEHTDNKVFRYLNILLTTSYQIASRLNEISSLMDEVKDASIETEAVESDLDWSLMLEKLYTMTEEIRDISSQIDISVDQVNKLKVDESNVLNRPQLNPAPMSFNPQQTSYNQQPVASQQPIQSQTPRQLTPEEIIKGNLNTPYPQPMGMMQPMMNPNMMQPMMNPNMAQYQQPMPLWMQREYMAANPNINPAIMNPNMIQQPIGMQQHMMPQQPMGMMQPMMNPNMMQPMMNPNMMQPQMNMAPQPGIPINYQFVAPTTGIR